MQAGGELVRDMITEQILILKNAQIQALQEQVVLLKSQVEMLEGQLRPVATIVQGPWRKVH